MWDGETLTAEAANRNISCVVMIESAEGLSCVEEIAAVDGVSQLFIGPYDLSLSLGTTVQALLDDDSASQADVDDAVAQLTSALAGLTGTAEVGRIALDAPDARFSVLDKVYTGSQIGSGFTVTLNGVRLYEGIDFATSTLGANRSIGLGTVTIVGKGDYSGITTLTFRILPKATSVSKLKAGKRSLKVTYKLVSSAQKVSKYQVRYRIKGTSTWKSVSVSPSKSSVTLTKLKKGKVYQVQVRSYKTVSGVNYYSAWSASKYSKKIK